MRVEQARGRRCDRSTGRGQRAKSAIRALHVNDKARLLKHNLASALVLGLMAAALWSWQQGWWPLLVFVWLLAGHFAHAKAIALHEASHGTLNANPLCNELQGILIGALTLVPLGVYRVCHERHHAYLAEPRDPELWPFTLPGASRSLRLLAAAAEIVFGFFYVPLLFLRGVLVGGKLTRRQRRRILAEYALCGTLWATVLTVVGTNGWWLELLVAVIVPLMVAGSFQTLNKYTEHMGLLGDTVLGSSRTVIDKRPLGKLLSRSLLNVDYHGTHHRYARVPYYNLPAATDHVFDGGDSAGPVYDSYVAALVAMLRTLPNPRIGRQWLDVKH